MIYMTFSDYVDLCESEDTANHAQKYAEKQKKLDAMAPEKHVEKLKKTGQSMINHVNRGGSFMHADAQRLASRYDDHAERLHQNHPEVWKAYCKEHGYSTSHRGADFYA